MPKRRTTMTAILVVMLGLLSIKSEAGPGGALNFDGMNTYVDIGYVLPGGHSYTKEAWIRANQSSTHNIITGDDDPFWLSGDHLRAAHGWQRIPSDIQDPETFPLGVWVYVAVTYDAATTTMRLYKNGVEVASSTDMLPAGTTYLQVGAYNSSNLFDGDIDEVRVWDRALCIGELQAHMNGELTGSENGLIVYYKFNDGILGAVNTLLTGVTDASGHGNNGTLHNFPLIGTIGNFVQGTVTGNADIFIPPTATVTAGASTTVTQGSSVALAANSSTAYQWMKDATNIEGATAQTYNASATGDYSVMVTIDNGCTNVSTPVHVTVNAVAIPLTPPANISACNNQNGNSKTLTLSTAGLTSPTVTYAITGATTGTGTGATVTKNFNVGVSTVTWTVTDAANGTRNCAATVTILELPTATISTSKPDAFCNELAVMVKSSHATTTAYNWTYNNASYATSQIIDLDNSKNDGYYYAKVTDQNGCQSNSVSYNYQKQNMANSYTLLAYKSIDLAYNNDILSGAIGVMNWGGDIDMDWSGSVPSTGWAKASSLDISCYATVSRKYYSQASNIALPTMLTGNTTAANGLSNYTKTSSGTVTNNYKTLTINSWVAATIKGTMYHKIKIGSHATVTFTAADISLDSLDISSDAKVIFSENTIVRVSKAVTMDDRITLNSAAKKVTFYMSDAVSDIIKFDVGNNCNITANVFMPKGKLNVNDGNNNDCWKTANNCHGHNHNNCNNSNTGTFMIGYYIAERINAGTNVTWDNYTCLDVPVGRQTNNGETAVFTNNEIGSVNVFPNPNNGTFRIAMPELSSNATIRVYDITGKVIISKEVAQADTQILDVNIANAAKGVYIVEVKGGGADGRTKMIVE